MNYEKLETKMRESYGPIAQRYRADDEVDARGEDHCEVCGRLRKISSAFDHPISVLDVGCGTGRYFHCLQNVEKLIGLDVSQEMLDCARNPVRADEVTAKKINLICGNLYTVSFPHQSFDLIYSIGLFGNGCALNKELCQKFYRWLKPGGYIFFDAIDASNVPPQLKFRLATKNFIYSLLPQRIQDAWDERTGWLPFFITSSSELKRLLYDSQFLQVQMVSRIRHLTLGTGRKLECGALKLGGITDLERFGMKPQI